MRIRQATRTLSVIRDSRLTILFASCCLIRCLAECSTNMSFAITRNQEQLPSYLRLCKLADQNQVHVTGDERTGSFSFRCRAAAYEFTEDRIHGIFAGHGVAGEFSFESGKAIVTITDKPFWLPEMLLRQKITEGLDALCAELASQQSS
jgi:hypothetical protein